MKRKIFILSIVNLLFFIAYKTIPNKVPKNTEIKDINNVNFIPSIKYI